MKKIIIALVFLPNILNAQVIISEIMYSPEGSDSGREWIEIYNSSGESVDLSEYKIYENEVNHVIKAYNEGNTVIKSGEYAIIVDNPEKFLIDYSYSGIFLDSAFSLNNTGELISLVDSESNVIHSVTYTSDWGADGDGNSLQYIGDDWSVGDPTPGLVNNASNSVENSVDVSNESTHSDDDELTKYEEKVNLKVGLGRDRYTTVNTPVRMNFKSNIKGAKAYWSYGDGGEGKGDDVNHTYHYPGTYNVVLRGEYDEEIVSSRVKVLVREPKLDIQWITSGKHVDILLTNESDFEVNLGNFLFNYYINGNRQSFRLPDDTIIDAKSNIYIPGKISDLEYEGGGMLKLYYPNGVEYK